MSEVDASELDEPSARPPSVGLALSPPHHHPQTRLASRLLPALETSVPLSEPFAAAVAGTALGLRARLARLLTHVSFAFPLLARSLARLSFAFLNPSHNTQVVCSALFSEDKRERERDRRRERTTDIALRARGREREREESLA